MDKDSHRVHFDEKKDLAGKENEINIKKIGSKLEVHLGFLQLNHRYKIAFSIQRSLCETSSESKVIADDTSHSPHVKIVDIHESKDRITFQVELYAHKEHLMIEELIFRLTDLKEPVSVLLNARVLGKGKGTPLLKNEIHTIHGPVEEDSDASSDFPDQN